tara:strand:+ start:952 stop:1236 length:285 start_codon:yes stop_codon:yes gene_type:complete
MSTKIIIAIPLNGVTLNFCMDIRLSNKRNGTQLEPMSVHGMLWLQTHFESNHWEAIRDGLVVIPLKDAEMLAEDAQLAGISINFINSLSQIDKI